MSIDMEQFVDFRISNESLKKYQAPYFQHKTNL